MVIRDRSLLLLAGVLACGDAGGATVSTDASTGAASTGAAASSSSGEAATSTGPGSTGAVPTSTGEASSTGPASGTGEASSTGDGVGPGCAEHVTFATIQATIFTGCGGYIGCHLDAPLGGELELTEAVAYASLVGVASAIAPGELRVAPGDSAGSLLYRKLIDELAADDSEGGPMPKTMTAMMWSRLSDEQIEQVRCWIDEGAPND